MNEGNQSEDALKTAKWLLDIKAVNFRPNKPYTLTSGWASPVYIDCRWVISFPEARRDIVKMGIKLLERDIDLRATDYVAGGETAGIPYAAWIAAGTDKPMLYVRKKPKGFGRDAQIEGALERGKSVLLVEDLATDGGSKINFIKALSGAGASVNDIFVIFFYGIFPRSIELLEASGTNLHYLCTWADVLEVAKNGSYFSPPVIHEVHEFLENPIKWSLAHGGKGSDEKC